MRQKKWKNEKEEGSDKQNDSMGKKQKNGIKKERKIKIEKKQGGEWNKERMEGITGGEREI